MRGRKKGGGRIPTSLGKVGVLPLFLFLLTGCSGVQVSTIKTTPPALREAVQPGRKAEEAADRLPVELLPAYEKLTYSVRWVGLPIGTLAVSIKAGQEYRGREVYLLEAVMKTNDFLSRIYRIGDRYISYMDARKLHTLRHEVYRRDGSYKKDAVTEFDQDRHRARFKDLLDNSEKTFPVPPGVHDLLSSFFHFQLIPLSAGDTIEYYVCNNEKNYTLIHSVVSSASLRLSRLRKEPWRALVVEPAAFRIQDNSPVKKGRVTAYFSSDPRRILLMAVVKGPIFTRVTFTLENIERKYPQKSGDGFII
ncbi:MAG: DUF3108 domain-containing protein [Candidatus Omnitrophica bacterium]|nr:DUF3108 domain-containing protein [Candidatus Omnitrophota bacterium]